MTLNYSDRSASGSAVGGASEVTQAELTALETAYQATDTALQTNIDAKADATYVDAQIAIVQVALQGIGERISVATVADMTANTAPNGSTFRVADDGDGKWALYERIGGTDEKYLDQDDLVQAITTLSQAQAVNASDTTPGMVTGQLIAQAIAAYGAATTTQLTAETTARIAADATKLDKPTGETPGHKAIVNATGDGLDYAPEANLENAFEFDSNIALRAADLENYRPNTMYFGRNTSASSIEFLVSDTYRGTAPIESTWSTAVNKLDIPAGAAFYWYFKPGLVFRIDALVERFSQRNLYMQRNSPAGDTGTPNQWHPWPIGDENLHLINRSLYEVTGPGEILFKESGIYQIQGTFELAVNTATDERLLFGMRNTALSDPGSSTLWRGSTKREGTEPIILDPSGSIRITAPNTTRILAFLYSGPDQRIGYVKVTITKMD